MVLSKSAPNKYEFVFKESFNTVRTSIFQVVHILLKPGELKSQIGDPYKLQQNVLKMLLNTETCKCPKLAINLLTDPINVERMIMQSSLSDNCVLK